MALSQLNARPQKTLYNTRKSNKEENGCFGSLGVMHLRVESAIFNKS